MLEAAIWLAVKILVIGAVVWGLSEIIKRAPFIVDPWKSIALWVVFAGGIIAALLLLVRFAGIS